MPLIPPEGLVLPPNLLSRLEVLYEEPWRAYHDTTHLHDVLARFAVLARAGRWVQPHEAFLALAFHDAVYVPGASDNEEESARLAEAWLAPMSERLSIPRIGELVRLTAKHGRLAPEDVDADAALLLDCDVAILAADPAAFDRYEKGVRREFSMVPPEAWAAGRGAFIEGMLAQPRIFLSDDFAPLEEKARTNLQRALTSLCVIAGGARPSTTDE